MEHRKQVLTAHGIQWRVLDGRLIADDVWTQDGELHVDSVDIMNMSSRQFNEWLGY